MDGFLPVAIIPSDSMTSISAGRVLFLGVGFVLVLSAATITFADSRFQSRTDVQSPNETTLQTPSNRINTTMNYLEIPASAVQSNGFSEPYIDVTTATNIDSDRLHVQLEAESFRIRYENADSVANRTAAVREAIGSLESDIDRFRQYQTTAREQYNRDEITGTEFVEALIRSHAAAENVRAASQTILLADDEVVEYEIQSELEARLKKIGVITHTLSGAVRNRSLDQTVSGSEFGIPVYVETSDHMIVLAIIDDGEYVREAFNRSAFDLDSTNEMSISDVVSRSENFYPWMIDSSNRNDFSIDTLGNSSTYVITIQHVRGELNAYLDAGTTNVFREDQTRDLDTVPVETVATNASEVITLTVNSTHETGPMQVRVTQVDNGDPVDASVSIDGTPVGATGADGTRWTIDTRGETIVRVETDDGVTLSARIPADATAG